MSIISRGRKLRFCFLVGAVAALAIAALTSLPVAAQDDPTPPGPCEPGWVAPVPTSVQVSSVPIEVTSTTADYFVLYVVRRYYQSTQLIPVSVTLGESGTTTLSDNLRPLPAADYRVDKYQVASPGDLDGDCVDDLTELADLTTYNPVNPAVTVPIADGAIVINSHQTFQTLSHKGEVTPGLAYLSDLEYIKFFILNPYSATPIVYFINTNDKKAHVEFSKKLKLEEKHDIEDSMQGDIVYYPNVIAPDGTLGVYRFSVGLWNVMNFQRASLYNEILAAAMPVVDDNLFYYPLSESQRSIYQQEKSLFDASRVRVLLDEDVLPDVDFIPLNEAEGYGRLRLMEDGETPGAQDVAIFKTLPNDLPRVAGTITTVPQTPLSHVNLRAIQNGLPNAFIRDALTDKTITSLIGKPVYFVVTSEGYTIREATKAEVDQHHKDLRPATTQTLQRDLSVTAISSLANVSFDDWDAFGVKAANMAELSKLALPTGTVPTGFAIPFYFYDEFMKANDLYTKVDEMLADPDFQSDYEEQKDQLKALRKKIKKATTPAWIITALEQMHATYPDGTSLRYRSSTNNEDLPAFNGAGLYDSKTQDPDETTDDGIDKSIKGVWASLWNYRAFLERDFHRVDHKTVAMGVLVHPNYSDELVNGVAVSYDPITARSNHYYINSQVGEDLVTNPQAYSQPEQLLLNSGGTATVLSRSNLATSDKLLMSAAQMVQLRNNLKTIHDRFATLYEVKAGDDYAIEIEFKITAANKLAIKQARPWIFPEPLQLANPTVTLALGPTQVVEGEDLDLTVTRSGGILSKPLTVDLTWSETSKMLKGTPTTSVTIPGNQTTKTITVPTDDDQEDEHDSVVSASIGTNSGYIVGTPGSASATVTDDDLTVIGVRAKANPVTEGSSVDFAFTRSGSVLEQPLTVSIAASDPGSRLVGTLPTEVTFVANSASASISIATTNDSERTSPSVVTVQIGTGTDYTIKGSGTAKVTIEDDELEPPTLLFHFNRTADSGSLEILHLHSRSHNGRVTYKIGGPDRGHFTDYSFARMILLQEQEYDRPADANKDGVYEIDLTATAALGGTTTVRLRFTVTTPELISLAQQHWDQLSQDQREDLLPEEESALLKAEFSNLVSDVRGSVLRLAQQQHLPSPGPTVSIGKSGDVTEGGDATFTVTAAPVPEAPLDVTVKVAQTGDFGVTAGARTVTIPTGGSVSFTVATSNDDVDEADGAVTVKANQGSGYIVSWTDRSAAVVVSDDDDPPVAQPEVSVTAGAAIGEGGDATFTVTATPAPSADLDVTVEVSQSGDYASTGSYTVTVPTSGSQTLTVTTTDDLSDEPDGSVTATVGTGTGYTVSSSAGSATVVVSDDDVPSVPEVSIAAGSAITEGGDATFTVTASPKPSADLDVTVEVSQSGDYASAGSYTVTVPTSGSQTLTVTTSDDSDDEPDGSVTAAVGTGTGYTVSSSAGSATVAVSDDDVPSVPEVSIAASADVTEGGDAVFTVTATPKPSADLDVTVEVSQSGDYVSAGSRTVTIPTSGSQTLTVTTTDDSDDEPDGSVTATVGTGTGYTVSSSAGSATVAVSDDDVPSVPEVSIAAGSAITEGADASFTVTATPAPSGQLGVGYTVSQTGDFGVSVTTGSVNISGGATSATFTITTADDDTSEADGSVTVTLGTSQGYTVLSGAGSATVAIADDDACALALPADAVTAAEVTGWRDTLNPAKAAAGIKRFNRVLATFGVETGETPMPADLAQRVADWLGNTRWDRIARTLAAMEQSECDPPPPPDPVISVTPGSAVIEGTDASFTITATPPPSADLEVTVEVSQNGNYVTTGSRTVTITTTGSATLTVSTTDDSTDEADGSVSATLSTGTGYSISSSAGAATVTVSDDDVPEISIAAGSGVTEGTAASFTVTASPTPAADLDVTISVSQSGDFATTGARTVTIPMSGSQTLTVATTNDSDDEPDGSVTATISTGTGYTVLSGAGSATVAIADDDACALALPADAVTAAEVTGWRDTLNPAKAAAGIKRFNRVLATFGVETGETPMPADLAQRVADWLGNTRWDRIARTLAAMEQSQCDTPPPVPVISIAAGSGVVEGGDALFTVTASPAPASALSVNLSVSQSGSFGVSTGADTVTIPTGGSATFRVSTTNDSADEPDGSVTATLSSGTGYTVSGTNNAATVSVSDDDDPPAITPVISITSGSGITEGGDALFTVTASPAPASALSVNLSVSQSGSFGVSTGADTVTIPTGGSATFRVSTTNDSADEPDGSVTATLSSGTAYTVSGTNNAATVSVSDDDDPPAITPVVSIAAGPGITEGGDATFTVTASPASALTVNVTVSQRGSFGASTGSRTVTIPTSGSLTFAVSTTNDSADEANGSVTATLAAGTGYTVSTNNGAATVAVSDDDDPSPPSGPITVTVSDASASEGTQGLPFVVTLSRASAQSITFRYGGFGRSAVLGQDFNLAYEAFILAPGDTELEIVVPVIDDSVAEADETLTVYVYSTSGITIPGYFVYASGTIEDDD